MIIKNEFWTTAPIYNIYMAQKLHRPPPQLWNQLQPAVKKLRNELTPAERQLWSLLRNRQFHAYKFRRQHSIDRFVVDFFCHQANLIIELDGPIHQSQIVEDQERQKFLEAMGFQVIRFTNDQIFDHPDQVLAEIYSHLHQSR